MEAYAQIINQINSSIMDFNEQLSEKHAIPALPSVTDSSFMNLAKTPWEQQFWPNKDANGVYFLFGYKESNRGIPALYIGKASLTNIGARLYKHLYHQRNEPKYRMNIESANPCVVEIVTSIDLSSNHAPSLAVALEEFLIRALRSKVYLMNSVGNCGK